MFMFVRNKKTETVFISQQTNITDPFTNTLTAPQHMNHLIQINKLMTGNIRVQ